MKKALLLTAAICLAACNGSEKSGPEKKTKAEASACESIKTIIAATKDKPPYSSLQGNNAMLGDRPLPDSWLTRSEFFGKTCRINKMGKFFGGETDFYSFSCTLYEARGTLDKETRSAEARAIVDELKSDLDKCLPEGWVSSETTEDQNFEVYYKVKYEPENFESPFKFTADPVYLELTYTPFMSRSAPSGWNVKLQFQEQVPAAE